ncbi:esterase/lipase family protein [Actinoplanes sp. CA-030573]|uniref:esterase/lipase family protein n=1 Tax=Actinoplanes sp. CA-030573 TaxID=3239898 RepID=UPI003D89F1FA
MTEGNVVFIHGFWSSPRTWDRLAEVLADDLDLAGLRWHRFGYASPKYSLPLWPVRIPDYDDIAQSLRPFLQQPELRGDVAIVTHSQGGLILLRYLAWMLNEGRGAELARIRSVVLLVCPHEGTDYARSIRAVLRFGQHPQARALRTLDERVAAARRTVLNQVVHATAVSNRECPIPIHVYAGQTDKVVGRVTAQSSFPHAAVLPGDHFSILDPGSPNSLTAPTVKRHLVEDLKAGEQHPSVPTPDNTMPPQRSGRPTIKVQGSSGVQIGDSNTQFNTWASTKDNEAEPE